QDVRGAADEDAAVVADDRRRPGEFVEENCTLIEAAVAVGVLQQADVADQLLVLLGVVSHLDDVEPAVLVAGQGDRVQDQRLGGDLLDAEAGQDLEGLEGVGGGDGRDARQLVLVIDLGRRLAFLGGAGRGQQRGEEGAGEQTGGGESADHGRHSAGRSRAGTQRSLTVRGRRRRRNCPAAFRERLRSRVGSPGRTAEVTMPRRTGVNLPGGATRPMLPALLVGTALLVLSVAVSAVAVALTLRVMTWLVLRGYAGAVFWKNVLIVTIIALISGAAHLLQIAL